MNLSKLKIYWPIAVIFIVAVIFFKAFFFEGKLPIPGDTIVGLYHPFRDIYAKEYPNGVPFKNFLITDPVRQQYPWRDLAISIIKKGQLPLWNPYSLGGYPLLANQQSAVFYPLNIFFLFLPFSFAWSLLIFLGPLMAGIFLYLYLRNLGLQKISSFLGAICFAFSGFSVAWLEWGTILHVALWLPLILLSIDRVFTSFHSVKISNFSRQLRDPAAAGQFPISNKKLKIKNHFIWSFIFIFALISSFFAGHLQTFFYVFLLVLAYLIARWWQHGKKIKPLIIFAICYLVFAIATAVQWIPTLQLIGESARVVDQADWQKVGWFLPPQHLIQFIAPDFFGNPATLNYWGVWNYGEFVGYIGILPFVFAIIAMLFRRDKKTLFFAGVIFGSLLFALSTPLAKLPFILSIPFLSTAQPTRLLFLIDFSLCVLAALGFDFFRKQSKKWTFLYPLGLIGIPLVGFWVFAFGKTPVLEATLGVVRNNLILPTALFVIASLILSIYIKTVHNKKVSGVLAIIIVGVALFDLLRFGWKFTPFTNAEYLFPSTKSIEFLQENAGQFRIMTTDARILPPNFSLMYHLQTIDGYDPLYPLRFGELIAASERNQPNINPPFGFNRIITPQNYNSKIIDLLGVKYVLALTDLDSPKLKKVFQEGQTRIYENKNVMPRVFFVETVYVARSKKEAIQRLFDNDFQQEHEAVLEIDDSFFNMINITSDMWWDNSPVSHWSIGKANIIVRDENRVVIKTENKDSGFLIFTDTYYHTWDATIDKKRSVIYRSDYNFRGVEIPKGEHIVEFINQAF